MTFNVRVVDARRVTPDISKPAVAQGTFEPAVAPGNFEPAKRVEDILNKRMLK